MYIAEAIQNFWNANLSRIFKSEGMSTTYDSTFFSWFPYFLWFLLVLGQCDMYVI